MQKMLQIEPLFLNYRYDIPFDLRAVLSDKLKKNSIQTKGYQTYLNFFQCLKNIKNIPEQHYWMLQRMFLDIQACYVEAEANKLTLKGCNFKFGIQHLVLPLTDKHSSVEVNSAVVIKAEGIKKCYCTVESIDKKSKTITIMPQERNKNMTIFQRFFNHKGLITIRFLPCFWSLNASHCVWRILGKYDMVHLMYPKLQTTPYILFKKNFKWNQPGIEQDHEQQQAVINIFNQTAKPAPYILFGPPGTGKTTTLVETILQIWQSNSSKYILVCASSNTAVDEIAKRLISKHIIPCQYIYRMYSATTKCEDIDETIMSSANCNGSQAIFLRKEYLFLKHIVLTTLTCCVRLIPLNLPKDHFSYIFIDEASQCQETEALIPYALTCTKNVLGQTTTHAQIVLCGDPFQLGPTVHCNPIEHLLGKSVIERLMQCELYKLTNNNYNPRYITRLTRNYRSREPIIHLSNLNFYDNTLKACCDFDETKWKLKWPELKNNSFPLVCCAVYGEEQSADHQTSVYNKREVVSVIHYVKQLRSKKFNSYRLEEDDIGIVTPFTAQKLMIQKALSQHNLNKIVVGTVDIFQGKEKKVIIISTVRSKVFVHNDETHIGFLSHPKRFNVALTRGKLFVLVIGNPKILCTNNLWKQLWQYCTENNACITPNHDQKENEPLNNMSKKATKKKKPSNTEKGSNK